VPTGTGYKVFVYYRATSGDSWGIFGMSSGGVDVTAVFSAIDVTAPTGTTAAAQGDPLDVTWTTDAAVTSGEFSIWVVTPDYGSWYAGKLHDAADTVGPNSYADSVNLDVPTGTGYKVFVYYRATSGDSWGIFGMSSGGVDVGAP
jgi:hypothetical protein